MQYEELPEEYFAPSEPEPVAAYNFLEAWNRGVIPNNKQILQFLQSWESSPILASDSRLSPAGLGLVNDVKELGRLLIRVVKERNNDELLQRFMGHARLAGRVVRRKPTSGTLTLIDDREARRRFRIFGRGDVHIKSEARKSRGMIRSDAQEMMSLGQLVVTSMDFRTLLQQIQSIIKRIVDLKKEDSSNEGMESQQEPVTTTPDVLTDGRPPFDKSGFMKKTVATEAPVAGLQSPSISRPDLEKRLGHAAEQVERWHNPGVDEGATPTVTSVELYPSAPGVWTPSQEATRAAVTRQEHQETYASPTREAQVETNQESIKSPPQTKPPPAQEEKTTSPNDQILNDAKPIFRQLGENEDFRKGIQGIWAILVRWQRKASEVAGAATPTELQYDANFAAAQQDLLSLMERFANGASLDPLLKSIKNMIDESKKDYELADFLGDWRSFLERCIDDPAYLDHDEYYRRGKFLLDRTTEYSDKKYRRLFQDNIEHWNNYMKGLQGDPITKELSRLLTRMVNQDLLGLPEGGAPPARGLLNLASIQTSLIGDLRNVIFPSLLKSLYELPLPHMELEQDGMRMSLDNVVLPAALFAPADLNITTRSALHLTPKKGLFGGRRERRVSGPGEEIGRWRNGSHVSLSGMRGEIKNIHFAMDRKVFPKLRDHGLCDVRLAGSGLNIAFDFLSDISASERRFHIEPAYVRINLDRLIMKFYQVEHDTIFSLLRPYLQYTLKQKLERAICNRIVDTIRQVDYLAYRLTRGIGRSTAA